MHSNEASVQVGRCPRRGVVPTPPALGPALNLPTSPALRPLARGAVAPAGRPPRPATWRYAARLPEPSTRGRAAGRLRIAPQGACSCPAKKAPNAGNIKSQESAVPLCGRTQFTGQPSGWPCRGSARSRTSYRRPRPPAWPVPRHADFGPLVLRRVTRGRSDFVPRLLVAVCALTGGLPSLWFCQIRSSSNSICSRSMVVSTLASRVSIWKRSGAVAIHI